MCSSIFLRIICSALGSSFVRSLKMNIFLWMVSLSSVLVFIRLLKIVRFDSLFIVLRRLIM